MCRNLSRMYVPLILDLGLTWNLFYLYWIRFHAWIIESRLLFIPSTQGAWQTKCTDSVLLVAAICLSCLGMGREEALAGHGSVQCVAVAATQFSTCKISPMPLWTYSLRCWITILSLPKSARMSLWCSPVISMRTAFTSVYNRSAPCSQAVVFHTIKPHRWPLSCRGCKDLSFFLFVGDGGH